MTVTIVKTGCPYKIDEKIRRNLVREASKRPTARSSELQEFLASTGFPTRDNNPPNSSYL